jgi:hypothetical protein
MQRTYYVGEGTAAKDIIDAACAKIQAFRAAGNALLEGLPEGAMILAQDGGQGHIIGFGIRQKLTADEMAYCGLICDVMTRDSDGTYIQCYKPNGRSAKGKELRKRMNTTNKLHTTFSKEVVATLQIDRWLMEGRMIFMSSAGCNSSKLFISIPGSPDDEYVNKHGGDKFPVIPAWFRAPEGDEAMFFLTGK